MFKVEYDLDEEDKAWLTIINQQRETSCLAPVSADSLELLMDRFEKESYFQVLLNVSYSITSMLYCFKGLSR